MSKGRGGGHGGSTGGGGAPGSPTSVGQAVADINAAGIGSRSVAYLRGGMREKGGRKGAFAGATRAEANAIATGRMGTKDWGKKFDPIKVSVEYKRPGGKPHISIVDGRHRMIGARGAGATRIRAEIQTSTKIGGKWVDAKRQVRIINIKPARKP